MIWKLNNMAQLNIITSRGRGGIIMYGDQMSYTQLLEEFEACTSEVAFGLKTPSNVSPRPGVTYLAELHIICSVGLTDITVDGTELMFSGAHGNLQRLARDFRSFIEDTYPNPPSSIYHSHIEYYPEHPFLAESAVPLILCPEEYFGRLRGSIPPTSP